MDKEILEMLQQLAMMKLVDQLKFNDEFDDETRGIINRYLQMHHDMISEKKKLEFTAVDGVMMAGLLETVVHFKEKLKIAEELAETLHAELKLYRGAF